jgi:hypothetical protein
MGTRRAAITTNVGQNPACVIHGESGLLCAAEALGAAARQRVGEHFLWDAEAAQSCEIAYEMANRRARLTQLL